MEPKRFMSDYTVVGLCGPTGVGKDYAANLMADVLRDMGKSVLVMAFADPMYDMLSQLTVVDCKNRRSDRTLKEQEIPNLNGKSLRYLAQTLGTEWGRILVDSEIWLKEAMARIHNQPTGTVIILTDVRFADEERLVVDQLGGIMVRIDGDNSQYALRDAQTKSHISEQYHPNVDYVIHNDYTPDGLKRNIMEFLDDAIKVA